MIRAIQVLLVCVFTAMLGLGIVSPIMPLYAKSLGATFVQIGLLSSAWSISRLVFTPPFGRLSDTRSKKKIIACGLATYMVVSILYTFAWDFTSLVSMRFLHGLGSAMAMPIATAYAAELAPEGSEGRFMGTMNFALFAGMGLGPFIGGYLTDAFSLSAPFYFMGALTALSLLLTLLFLPEERRRSKVGGRPRPSFRKVLSNRLLRAAFIYRVVGALGRGSIMGFLALFISGSTEIGGLAMPVSVAGLILSAGTTHPAGRGAERRGLRPPALRHQRLEHDGRPTGHLGGRGDGDARADGHRRHRGEEPRGGHHHGRLPERHEHRYDRGTPALRPHRGHRRPQLGVLRRRPHHPRGDSHLLRAPEDPVTPKSNPARRTCPKPRLPVSYSPHGGGLDLEMIGVSDSRRG